jgi:hypothetical protein
VENPQTPERILQLGLAFWGAKTLLSAVELDLFSTLAAGPLEGGQLAQRLGLHPRSARDFLDALVALGMLQRTGESYANTPETGLFLDRNKPSYIGGILEMANARLYPHWGRLTEALRTGEPQGEAKAGGNTFEALYADPRRLEQFAASMTGISMGAAKAIAAKFPWARYQNFIDLGCAQGGLPVQLALAHPHLHGIGYDLPALQPVFESYVRSFDLQQRLRFQAGNFMTDPLPSADVLVMGHILHDWDLEQKKMLVAKAYAALSAGGALIVFDAVIDDARQANAFGLLMSLNMLIETRGGFDYTAADGRRWLTDAGFKDVRVEPLVGHDSMVIGVK